MLHFDRTPEQAMFQDSAARFTRETGTFENRQAICATVEGFSRDNWRVYAGLGWLALTVPVHGGGLGGSLADLSALMQGLAPALILEPLVASSVLAAAIVERAQDDEMRISWLRRIASGEAIVVLAHDEPGDLPEARPMSVRADGHGYRLSGTKILCWHAPAADRLLVTAPIAGRSGRAIFLVDARAPGLVIEPYRLLDGTAAGDIHFDNVYVDAASLIVGAAESGGVLDRAQDRAIIALSAEAVGMMQQMLLSTTAYLKTRVQFGSKLAKFQALQHRIAEMFVRYQDAVSVLHYAVAAADEDVAAPRATAVSTAKVVIGEACRYVGAQSIQLHGAIGVTEEYLIGHYYRRCLVFEKIFGDMNFHLDRYRRIAHRAAEGAP